MSYSCWQLLDIEQTTDLDAIRAAYRKQLPLHHPETDPDGFKQLRLAYEQAQAFAQNPESQSGEPQEVVEQLSLIANSDPDKAILDNIINEYNQLLTDPNRHYQPEQWQFFIDQINQHPIEVVEKLREPLLKISYETDFVSRDCLRLLSARLRWQGCLARFSAEDGQMLSEFLERIESGDLFDLSKLSDASIIAQKTTVHYIQTLHYLFWQQPFDRLSYYLHQHTVCYLPNDETLIDELLRWSILAHMTTPELLAYCEKKLSQNPDNEEWLYLTARQALALGEQEKSLTYWLTLYHSGHYQEKAKVWLANWCLNYSPERLPLLIWAMNNSVCWTGNDNDLSDEALNSIMLERTPATLAHLLHSSLTSYSPLVKSFIDWCVSGDLNYRDVLPLLLQDDGRDPLIHLYRHAIMLKLGNETLLNQIIDEPDASDPLDNFILQQLKRQALQEINWLTKSKLLKPFTEWLYDADNWDALPNLYTDNDQRLKPLVINWLRRLRHLPTSAMSKLYNNEILAIYDLGMFDWHCYLFNESDLHFSPPQHDDPASYWNWYRIQLTLLALVYEPLDFFDYLQKDQSLLVPESSVIYAQLQAIKSVSLNDGELLADKMYDALPEHNVLSGFIGHRLPISIAKYLSISRSFSFENIHNRITSAWLSDISKEKMVYVMFLKAIFAHQTCWKSPVSQIDELKQSYLNCKLNQEIQTRLIAGQFKDALQLVVNPPFALNLIVGQAQKLHDNQRYICSSAALKSLSYRLNDESEDKILRLCAGLLIYWSESRAVSKRNDKKDFWKFWQLGHRINRTGFIGQILFGFCVVFVLHKFAYLLPEAIVSDELMVSSSLKWLFVANLLSAIKRRFNDLFSDNKYSSIKVLTLTCLFLAIPPLMLILASSKGQSKENRFGTPAK